MDFSKAFDKVCHNRLLFKLAQYNVNTETLRWISSFLKGREQRVLVDGKTSQSVPVTSGVPQGSVLGPILFLAFINDLPLYVTHSTVRLFADDTMLYLAISSTDDCQKLQSDLSKLEIWEQHWLMNFHPAKCQVIKFTKKRSKIDFDYILHGQILEEVESAKYLGVTFSNNFSFSKHIDTITAKANKSLGFIKRNIKVPNPQVKAHAFQTLVRPSLEYCSSVWHPDTDTLTNQIEMVQHRAARWVTKSYSRHSSIHAILNGLGWRELAFRRIDCRLVMLFKIVNGKVLIDPNNYFMFQRGGLYIKPVYARTLYYGASFFPSTIKLWNTLPASTLQATSVEGFKKCVNQIQH